MNNYIIERPELQSTVQKMIYGILTLGWWLFWFYLWLPLIGPWISDHPLMRKLITSHKYTREQYWILVDLFIIVGIAALIIAIVMGIWAYYNLRNPGRERRRRPTPVSVDQLARFFVVKAPELHEWQREKRLIIHYDEQGVIQRVDSGAPIDSTILSQALETKPDDKLPNAYAL